MLAFGTVNTKTLGAISQLYSDGKRRDGKRRAFGRFGTFFERLSGTTGGANNDPQ